MAAFASASGDHSPLHSDPEFGRRTAFGAPIVYGGLETIALLGLLPEHVQARVRRVRSVFAGPVLIGEAVSATAQARPDREDEWELVLRGRGLVLARVTVGPGAASPAGARRPSSGAVAGAPPVGLQLSGEYADASLAGLAGELGAGAVPGAVLDGIAWASHAVGAAISGFHGLCAAVTVDAGAGGRGATRRLHVVECDERTDRIVIQGGVSDAAGQARCECELECFPFAPTPLAAPSEFAGRAGGTVVVVGGSRGAGGALALALLGAGYDVHVVFAGAVRAAADLRELAGPAAPRLTLHQLDSANAGAVDQLVSHVGEPLDGLVLCAAPAPLPMALTPETAGQLAAFVASSVTLGAVPLSAFAPRMRRPGGWVICFSAAEIEAPSRGTPQLAAAKAALEGVARAAAVAFPGLAVLLARVPAMATDLANTPAARRRAVAPEAVAADLVARVAQGVAPGVTVASEFGAHRAFGV